MVEDQVTKSLQATVVTDLATETSSVAEMAYSNSVSMAYSNSVSIRTYI